MTSITDGQLSLKDFNAEIDPKAELNMNEDETDVEMDHES